MTDSGFGAAPFGYGPFGLDAYEGGTTGHGVFANVMLLSDIPSQAIVEAMAAATSPLGALPSPEADLVWYLAGEARPMTTGSPLAGGLTYETETNDGGDRVAQHGLTKALAVLRDGFARGAANLSIATMADEASIGVLIATTAAEDDLADQHAQFGTAPEGQVNVTRTDP